MGHTEEVNEQYYTYDVSNMQDKQLFVQMVTKEIAMSKEENTLNQKVIKMIFSLYPLKPRKFKEKSE